MPGRPLNREVPPMKLTTVFAIATLMIFAGADVASTQIAAPATTPAKPAAAAPAGTKPATPAIPVNEWPR